MKRAFRNLLALCGLLLMVASFVWLQLRQAERSVGKIESRTAKSSAASKPFAVVVLDPGHGGQHPGAVGCGVLGKKLTLVGSRRIGRPLKPVGMRTLMTPVGDTSVFLADSARMPHTRKKCHFC